MTKTVLLTGATLIATALFHLLLIGIAAGVTERASTSAAGTAVMLLLVIQLITAVAAVVFIYRYTGGPFQGLTRSLWVAVYALLQFGIWIFAALITLVALNR